MSSSHLFTKVCQNLLVVDLVNSLTFRHPIHVNNPSDVEKTIIFALNLDLLCLAFFCLGELGLFSAWIGAYFLGRIEKTMIHHRLLRFLKVWVVFNILKNVSTNVNSNFLLFRSEESRHHLRTHFFHVQIVSKICRTVSLSMLINSATARMLRRRFCLTISPTFSTLGSALRCAGTTGALIVSDLFPPLFKPLKPHENLSTRQTLVTINFL